MYCPGADPGARIVALDLAPAISQAALSEHAIVRLAVLLVFHSVMDLPKSSPSAERHELPSNIKLCGRP